MGNGKLIILEGPRGIGKSTVSDALAAELKKNNFARVLQRSFPGDVEKTIGSLVYNIHHNQDLYLDRKIAPLSLQMLHVASHIDNLQTEIIPELNKGSLVILHRCWWSTLVFGRIYGCDKNLLSKLVDIERDVIGDLDYRVILLERNYQVNHQELELYNLVADYEAYWMDYSRVNIDSIQVGIKEIIDIIC